MSKLRSYASFAALIALGAVARSARAGDQAAAEALFVEARKLAVQGNYREACPKFAESNRLDRAAGTLIHLADCYEKNKQTATAWATFKEAASAAHALGRSDWEKLATGRAAFLEPKLAHLVVRVSDPVAGLQVTRDGQPMSQASWGVAIPTDVGAHAVAASAPGHAPFQSKADVTKDGDQIEIVVPKLKALPKAEVPAAPIAPVTPPSEGPSALRTLGFIVGGVGLAGLAFGGVTTIIAIDKNNTAKKECPNEGPCRSIVGVEANEDAGKFATISTISFIAGGVLAAAGLTLIIVAPSRSGVRSEIVPTTTSGGAGLLFRGTF